MTIQELIARLIDLQKITGNCEIEVRNAAGEIDLAGNVTIKSYAYISGKKITRILIDV